MKYLAKKYPGGIAVTAVAVAAAAAVGGWLLLAAAATVMGTQWVLIYLEDTEEE